MSTLTTPPWPRLTVQQEPIYSRACCIRLCGVSPGPKKIWFHKGFLTLLRKKDPFLTFHHRPPSVIEKLIQHHLLHVGLPSKGTVRAIFSWQGTERERVGRGIQIHGGFMSSPQLVHLKITMHDYYNWQSSAGWLYGALCSTLMSLLGGAQTLPLDFHQDVISRSGDREIWHKIKEISPKWSAHTYHVLYGSPLSICRSLGATANRVPKLHWAKNRHEFNHLYLFVRSDLLEREKTNSKSRAERKKESPGLRH